MLQFISKRAIIEESFCKLSVLLITAIQMSPSKQQCTEHEGASPTVKFTIFFTITALSHLSSAHSKENCSVYFGVIDSLVESIHCLFIIKNPVNTGLLANNSELTGLKSPFFLGSW